MAYKWIGRAAGAAAALPLSYYVMTGEPSKFSASHVSDQSPPKRDLVHFDLIHTRFKRHIPSTRFLRNESWNLLYFGFTHCAEICPHTIQFIDQLLYRIHDIGGHESSPSKNFPDIRCAFVSLDPYRDDSESIEKFLDRFTSKKTRDYFDGYCASYENTQKVAKAWKVYFSAPDENEFKENPEYQIDHSCFIFLVSPSGQLVDFFTKDMSLDTSCEKIQMHVDGAYDY